MEFSKNLDKFTQYLLYEKRYSTHTSIAYKKDLIQFFTFISEIAEINNADEIHYNHIRSWIVSLAEDNISNRSINRKITSLRTYFKFLQRVELLSTNPCDRISSLKIPKRLPQYIKKTELINLYDTIVTDENSFTQQRDYTILEMLYNTGIRKSELINIHISDIDFKNNSLVVLGKGKKERLIPLGTNLVQIVETYLIIRNCIHEVDSDILFVSESGNKLYPKAVYNIVKKYLSLLTTVEKRSPHTLRHSFATHLMNEGAELSAVKNLLGHSSLAATQVYTHNSIETLKDIYKNAHPKGK